MKDADQIILEGLAQTILEKTFPSELYHYSSLRSVGKMIENIYPNKKQGPRKNNPAHVFASTLRFILDVFVSLPQIVY